MAERSSTGLLMMMLDPSPAIAMTLPAEVREKLAELELELSEAILHSSHQHLFPLKPVCPEELVSALHTFMSS